MLHKNKKRQTAARGYHLVTAVLLMLLLSTPAMLLAQSRQIKGHVLSEDRTPLAGASINIAGTSTGVLSGADGSFVIDAETGDQLVINYTGFAVKTVTVTESSDLEIILTPDESNLSEVVVVGYGTQSRHDLSGAVGTVNPLAFKSSPSTNIGTALQGTVPGLKVQQSTGQPGSTPSMTFRGGNNWDGSGGPLVVLDGVIVPSVYGINMDDVESINLLKDAASTAIYGARASNGVLLVTTKKGKKGRTQVTYTIRQTNNYARKHPVTYLGAGDYIAKNWEGIRSRYLADSLDNNTNAMNTDKGQLYGSWGWALNSGFTSPEGLYTTQLLSDDNRHLLSRPDWQYRVLPNPFTVGQMDSVLFHEITAQAREDMIMQNQNTTEHSLNFSGGSDAGAFNLGLGAVSDNGVIVGSGLKRLSMNFNGGLNIGERLKVTTSMSAYSVKTRVPYTDPGSNSGATGGLLQRFVGVAPTIRYNNDTSGAILPGPNDVTLGNPNYWMHLYQNSSSEQRFMGSLNLEYAILPYLTLKASGSGFMRYSFNNYFTKAYQAGSGGAMNTTRPASFSNSHDYQYSYNAFLQFDKTLGGDHRLSVLGGGEFYDYKYYFERGAGQGAPTDVIPWLVASAPPSVVNGVIRYPQSAASNFSQWDRLASVIGRVNYAYKDKYYLTANMRYDGSSRLSANNHYGFFPGISAAWNLHNEDFFRSSGLTDVISTVKPRISWGQNGNVSSLGYFQTAQVYNNTSVYNGAGGAYVASYINTGLNWEKSASTNFGLDIGLFQNRVTLIADYFVRNVYDKIAPQPIDPSTGFTTYTSNLGELRNKGWEISLNAQVLRPATADALAIDFNANFYTVKNFAVKLPDNGLPGNRQQTIQVWDPNHPGQLMQVGGLIEGQRIGLDEVWAPKWDGIYTSQDQIDADRDVYNAFLPYNDKTIKQLGDARWHQVNPNDSIDSRQFVYVGRTTPTVTGSFATNISYKGFSLYAAFDYALGFVVMNNEVLRGLSQVQGSQNQTTEALNTWSPENPTGTLPRFYWANQGRNYATDASGNNVPANMWEKGDYLSMREVTLSYDFTPGMLERAFRDKIKSLRLFISGSNLTYFTSYSGSLPEIGGVDPGRYPLPRRFTFGATIAL